MELMFQKLWQTPSVAGSLRMSTSQTDEALPVDVSLLSEINKKALVDALNSVRLVFSLASFPTIFSVNKVNGSKTLVLDGSLAGPLGLVTEVALLKVPLS